MSLDNEKMKLIYLMKFTKTQAKLIHRSKKYNIDENCLEIAAVHSEVIFFQKIIRSDVPSKSTCDTK